MIHPNMSRILGQFPAALISLADEIFFPVGDDEYVASIGTLNEYLQTVFPFWEPLMENYGRMRNEIGAQ